MEKMIEFTGRLIQNKDMNAAYIEFPFESEKYFGKKGRVKVKVIFDDLFEYRGSMVKMGSDSLILGVTKEIRNKLNKTFGDEINVKLSEDIEKRQVLIPDYIEELFLENPIAKIKFYKMSYSHQKEYIAWIEDAKKEETRSRRLDKFILKLMEK